MSAGDVRQCKRVRFSDDVVIGNTVKARCANISRLGLFAYTRETLSPGSVIGIGVAVDGVHMNLKGAVQHCHFDVGCGIRFVETAEEQAAMIDRYVEAQQQKNPEERQQKILLVDHFIDRRALNRIALTQSGYAVFEANTEAEAFDIIRGQKPDMVIFDPYLPPIGDNLMFLKKLRLNPQWRNIIPVVLSSRPVGPDVVQRYFTAVRHILVKANTSPVLLQEIVDRRLRSAN